MTDTGESSASGGKVNKGLGLVAAFRAARMSQRPALQSELRSSRAALRQERLDRLGRRTPLAALATAPPTETMADDAAAKPEPAPAPVTGSSMFATFLNRAEELPAPSAAAEAARASQATAPAAPETVATVPLEVEAASPPEQPPTPEQPPRVPLSTIGFGPGMMIRMSHLGIETVQELAVADPAWLRTALGDISRLINVELWIASARNACSQAV